MAERGQVLSSDGVPLTIEPVAAEHRDALLALVAGLSERSAYQRFCGTGPRAGAGYVDVVLDPGRTLDAVMATWGDEVVAVASTHRSDDAASADEAEVAVLVDDRHQHRGVGTLLLEELARRSRARGISTLVALVLATNAQMAEVIRHSGLRADRHLDGELVVHRIALDDRDAGDTSERSAARREVVARAQSLRRLLAPASVAVVGAGTRRDGLGHQVVAHLRHARFTGPVHVVNRSGRAVLRAHACTRIEDLPHDVDLAVVAVSNSDTTDVVGRLARHGVGAVVVLGGREGDPDTAQLAVDVRGACRAAGVRVLGPGSSGLLSVGDASPVDVTTFPHAVRPGPVLVGSASGPVASGLASQLARRGLGCSALVTLGASRDVGPADLVAYAGQDPSTQVVLLYAERLDDPRALQRAAEAVVPTTPVVLLQPRHASSGTPFDDTLVAGLCRQAGITRVETLEELVDLAAVHCAVPRAGGTRLAVLGNAHGPALLARQAAAEHGLLEAETTQHTQMRLRHLMPDAAPVGALVDTSTSMSEAVLRDVLLTVCEDPGVDAVLVAMAPLEGLPAPVIRQAVDDVAARRPGTALVLCLTGEGGDVSGLVPVFDDPHRAALALARHLAWATRTVAVQPVPTAADLAHLDMIEVGRRRAAQLLAGLERGGEERWLEPREAAALLECYGIDVVPVVGGDDPQAAMEAASVLRYPLVLQGFSRPLAREPLATVHHLTSSDAVREAGALLQRTGLPVHQLELRPEPQEPCLQVPVVARRLPGWGPVLFVASGQDRQVAALAPVDAPALLDALRQDVVRLGKSAAERYGPPGQGVRRLARMASATSWLLADHPQVAEVDLGQVQVGTQDAAALRPRVLLRP